MYNSKYCRTKVALVVRDYDEAIQFYCQKLHFTLVEDTYQPEQDKRWVVVAPPGSKGTNLLLAQASTAEQEAFIGDQIAYLAYLGGPETWIATIMVIDIAGGEPRALGQFEDVWELAWVPDGSHVVFAFGHWESRQIMALNVVDGSQTVLAAGRQPALAGQ
jgi:catechol 2,3-dioxygenase-like lactoylglutathione lyase family enzyme